MKKIKVKKLNQSKTEEMVAVVNELDEVIGKKSRTEAEKDMELEPPFRLACQCRIKKGKVKIKV